MLADIRFNPSRPQQASARGKQRVLTSARLAAQASEVHSSSWTRWTRHRGQVELRRSFVRGRVQGKTGMEPRRCSRVVIQGPSLGASCCTQNFLDCTKQFRITYFAFSSCDSKVFITFGMVTAAAVENAAVSL